MIGNQVIFVVIPLFLTLITTISTAPILINRLSNETITTTEPIAYDNSKESDETLEEQGIYSTTMIYNEETTLIPEIVTSGHLFVDVTDGIMDIDLDNFIKTTTPSPEIVTSGLLFADATDGYMVIDLDNLIKTTSRFPPENEGELPSTPTTESPEVFHPVTTDHE
jgi:hypothetical protein